jgi:hypothetical protein
MTPMLELSQRIEGAICALADQVQALQGLVLALRQPPVEPAPPAPPPSSGPSSQPLAFPEQLEPHEPVRAKLRAQIYRIMFRNEPLEGVTANDVVTRVRIFAALNSLLAEGGLDGDPTPQDWDMVLSLAAASQAAAEAGS